MKWLLMLFLIWPDAIFQGEWKAGSTLPTMFHFSLPNTINQLAKQGITNFVVSGNALYWGEESK